MDPFTFDRDRSQNACATEFGWGRGMFADPTISVQPDDLPLGEPTQDDQLRYMAESKRANVAGGDGMDTASDPQKPSDLTYAKGNPDRFGAQPPLVRERGMPTFPCEKPLRVNKFQRKY